MLRNAIDVRDVQIALRLSRDRPDESRVGVPQAAHRDAREEVEIVAPRRVPEMYPFAMGERHRRPDVVLEEMVV